MLTRPVFRFASCLTAVLVLASTTGCREEGTPESPSSAAAQKTAPVEDPTALKIKAILANADIVDGDADKVVKKCPSCALSMDGSSEHALKAHGFTLHFCSENCSKEFAKDLDKSILAMKMPKTPEAPAVDTIAAETKTKMTGLLSKADLLDGKEDKIVTRCASCMLNMDGTNEHTVKVLDYTMYFCTEHCAKSFAKDTTKSVLAMKIPEGG